MRTTTMLHQKLIQHNELMELKDPGGYLDRAAPSDICYAKFVDFLSEESERDQAIAIVAVDLEYAHRSRWYWTNIPFNLPNDKNIYLKDILDESLKETSILSEARKRWLLSEKGDATVKKGYASIDPKKANCLTARSDASWNSNYVTRYGHGLTKLSCEEYEKLQTVPVGYTSTVRTTERYKMLGNGWTVDVIAHIFSSLPQEHKKTL